jgi:galactokinase
LENIDYNDGFVLPAAIDKIICVCSKEPTSKIVAIDLNQEFEIDLLQDIELSSTNIF